MAVIAEFLIDASAAARMLVPAVRARLEPLIMGGTVATCATPDPEALYSALRLARTFLRLPSASDWASDM